MVDPRDLARLFADAAPAARRARGLRGRKDARARNVADGDRIRVFSDVGEFEAMAKVAFSVRPGQVIIYHAWEPYQFKDGRPAGPVAARSSLCISR